MKTKDILTVLTESVENRCKQIKFEVDGHYIHVFGINADGSYSVVFHHSRLGHLFEALGEGCWFDYDEEKKVVYMTISVRY